MRLPLLTFLIFFCPCHIWAQEYSYTHYDISDGLAGSTVYCITQDKDGFIWTGTETGVSRFDGTHFHNYTAVDGLPDVEILEMFGDSKGRVWMAPFGKSICYFYKGKIRNQENDPLLHAIHIKDNVLRFAEDDAGNILIQEKTGLHLVSTSGGVLEFDSIAGAPIRNCGAISRSKDGHFLVQANNELYSLSDGGFTRLAPFLIESTWPGFISLNPSGALWRVDSDNAAIRIFSTGRQLNIPFERKAYRHLSYTSAGDSLYYFNEFGGAREYNVRTGQTKRFLPGKQVSRTYRDGTGNTWFTTLGQGIYRLNSDEFRTILLKVPSGTEESSVWSINRIGGQLVVGDNHNYIFYFSLPDMAMVRARSARGIAKNRIINVSPLPNGDILIAGDGGTSMTDSNFGNPRWVGAGLKSTFKKSPDQLLISSFWGVGLLDLHTMQTDTLWHERSTTVYFRKDSILIGTLNGLFAMPANGPVAAYARSIPFFRRRISALAESRDGTLWVASYDAGIIGYKNGQVIASITKQQGLTSDICRTLVAQGNNLWVGTDRGLNRIRLDQAGLPVTQYTSQDGLGSNFINAVFADSPVIYVGTQEGLSYFDETKVDLSEGCRLYLLSIINSDRERVQDTAALSLPYDNRHIRIEYAGISYRSVGGILYRYRLIGLDTAWRTTRETFLEYQALPAGQYQLQLEAVNKFGVRSAMLNLPFRVAAPFWQTVWFVGLVLTIFLSLVWLIVSIRIRYIRRRQSEKEELNRKVAEMEHMALQAQMNPHFIFNCMNSIQQYIFDQDVLAANKYIAGFSRLIRATLQNSTRAFITLPDEISYLSGYLSLEKLRFKEKMNYSIDVDPAVEDRKLIIPPMLIQPYVENSMRHGLRHKTDGQGHIHLQFRKTDDRLIITVEDNGIGRKKAGSFKTSEHIEYQSKGMSLTADRIRMMNAKYGNTILVAVTDLEDTDGRALGTRVTMEFPFFHLLLEKEDL